MSARVASFTGSNFYQIRLHLFIIHNPFYRSLASQLLECLVSADRRSHSVYSVCVCVCWSAILLVANVMWASLIRHLDKQQQRTWARVVYLLPRKIIISLRALRGTAIKVQKYDGVNERRNPETSKAVLFTRPRKAWTLSCTYVILNNRTIGGRRKDRVILRTAVPRSHPV